MAKPLGPKSLLIRQAITANPGKGNTELAEMLNGEAERKADKIKVTANDVAQQRSAMKQAGAATPKPAKATNGRKKPGRKPGRKTVAPTATKSAATSGPADPIDLIDKTLDLAQQCGGVVALKRLVDRLAEMQGR